MVLVDAKEISISFFGLRILERVNFQLKAGEIHCLCGENGAGKSTLVKILTGIYTHYTGEIQICGKPVAITNARVAREHGIYAVQQHRDLVPTVNAVENIFLGNEIVVEGSNRLDFVKMKAKSAELISRFGVDLDLDVPVRELRLSDQGIIAICKALAANSRILLIDEASAPLDSTEREVLYRILQSLRDEGIGIVYISHHLEEIFAIGERVTVLRNGELVLTVPVPEIDRDGLINAMTGNKKMYKRDFTDSKSTAENEILQFHKVSNGLLSDISFSIHKGEVIGFAGLEGSHKSEIANIAFGLSSPMDGSIVFKGKSALSRNPIQAIRKGIGLVPTDRKNSGLVTCRDVGENIILTAINRFRKAIVNSAWIRKATLRNIEKLGIRTSGPHQLVEYLSGGNQQKVLLSKWLEAGVDLLFLVEPTEGIDVGARADLYAAFRELVKQGKTLILFTSDIDELMLLSDRIFTMVDGRIITEYRTQSVEKRTILSDILSKGDERKSHEIA